MNIKSPHIRIEKKFLSAQLAGQLRSSFDSVYADPRRTPQRRFVWDHWHLENQYRLHRTLARQFLPPPLYKKLRDDLVKYGQEKLGCFSISEPWLSYYTEGDEQQFHSDSPHGPWAYVFSLTKWVERKFTGGETLIFRPETLNYWSSFSRGRGKELDDLMFQIPAEFNQLLVFDPRLPHGVRRVSGVHDPREARLVVHGWFVNPEPYVTGSLKMSQEVVDAVNIGYTQLSEVLALDSDTKGTLVYRLQILRSGQVGRIQLLTNTLISHERQLQKHLKQIEKSLKKFVLPKARGESQLTLPLVFD